jgi:hypothetical protein
VSTALPTVRYARSGDVEVAYQTLGDGPPDIVLVDGSITHLHVLWEEPRYRRFCERLASFDRLIRFDKRGMGMSDRVRAGTLEEPRRAGEGGDDRRLAVGRVDTRGVRGRDAAGSGTLGHRPVHRPRGAEPRGRSPAA